MIAYYHAVRETAERIAGAIDNSVAALAEGRVEQEPAMTDRMLGAIEQSLDNFTVKGIRWSAKTLTDHGPAAQEPEFGADFLGVLNITLPEFKVAKGFLAQAKLVRGGSSGNLRDLRRQCERMLLFTPDSFVFLYSEDGVRVVPAISVVGSRADPTELYSRSAERFFEEHLECFVGDRLIQSAGPKTLKSLRNQFSARSAILFQAEAGQPGYQR